VIRPLSRLALCALLAWPPAAWASSRLFVPPWHFPPPPKLASVRAYILVDAATGTVIAAHDAHRRLPPASLTKLMTAWLTYRALHRGTIRPDENIPVSVAAWRTGGSRMFIQPGLPVDVAELLHGLIIDSGNDAAVALAQAVAGSRSGFVALMNAAARQLGLRGTHYSDVDGLPAPDLHTTSYDIALLSLDLLRRDPGILRIRAEKSYRYNHITHASWNPLLFHDPWVDGLKTGHTSEAGYCMDETAVHDGRRLIAVVMGGRNWRGAMNAADTLLHWGFRATRTLTLLPAGATIGFLHLPADSPENVPYGIARPLLATVPRTFVRSSLIPSLKPEVLRQRPIRKGMTVGELILHERGQPIARIVALARGDTHPASWWTLLLRRLRTL
jgi:D-alanyl-D-alanine carboxypeptidase (penicillin-binding protein 5/6)